MTIDSQYYVRPRAQRTGNQRQPLMYIWHILRLFSLYLLPELGLFIGIPAVEAGIFFGSHKYYSKQACIDDKKLTREICENAEANAAAELRRRLLISRRASRVRNPMAAGAVRYLSDRARMSSGQRARSALRLGSRVFVCSPGQTPLLRQPQKRPG